MYCTGHPGFELPRPRSLTLRMECLSRLYAACWGVYRVAWTDRRGEEDMTTLLLRRYNLEYFMVRLENGSE